jgi:predicted nucleic acid-binding protein
MRFYADTSFFVPLRWAAEARHRSAQTFFEDRQDEAWLWSPWHRLEVFNTLRQLALDPAILSEADARALVYRLEADVRAGYYEHAESDWRDVLSTAQSTSEAHAFAKPCRAADLLHVAYALELSADAFVSFDADQLAIAKAVGLRAVEPPSRRAPAQAAGKDPEAGEDQD